MGHLTWCDANGRIIGNEIMQRRFAQACAWLESCDQDHSCKGEASVHISNHSATQRHFLPPRLIQIKEFSGYSTINLVDTADMPSAVDYCALSYCWGGYQQNPTTADNLAQYYLNIPLKELPMTLQDAIEVAARLGLEYLWIDSICIVQATKNGHDNGDWTDHVSMMGMIYASAYCTLIVSECVHAGKGFLRLGGYGSPEYRRPARCTIPFSKVDPEGSSETYVIYNEQEERLDDRETPPLEKRAWAMQESLLSSRRLIFGLHGLKFECREKRASERLPKFTSYTEMNFAEEHSGCLEAVSASLLLKHAVEGSFGAWASIVNMYNTRSLSFWSDKLAAFEGIAEYYYRQTACKESFAAGIRKSCKSFDLCWLSEGDSHGTRNPNFPSWSWASMQESRILFPNIKLRDVSKSAGHGFLPGTPKSLLGVLRGARTFWEVEIMDAAWAVPGTPQFADKLLNRYV